MLRILALEEVRAGILSGILVAISKPPSFLGPVGWVALVPLLLVLFSSRRQREG